MLPFVSAFERHLTIAVALAVGSAVGVAEAASLNLTPTHDHPKGSFTVSGSGFGAGELVDIYFDGIDVALRPTSAKKSFAAVTVPLDAAVAPGRHWITAVGRKSKLAAQKPFDVHTDWARYRWSLAGRGVNPYENLLGVGNVAGLGAAWTYKPGAAVLASPAVVDGIAYVTTQNGWVHAIDTASGTRRWRVHPTTAGFGTTPAVAGGLVVVNASDGTVIALDIATGAKKWGPVDVDGTPIISSPIIDAGKVYVVTAGGTIRRLDAKTGASEWNRTIVAGIGIYATPVIADGMLLIGSTDKNLYARDLATGNSLWIYTTAGPIQAEAAVAAGRVFVTNASKGIDCVDEDGVQVWTRNFGVPISTAPVVAGPRVFVVTRTTATLWALAADTGVTLWSIPVDGNPTVDSAPVLANGVVYYGTNDNKIHAHAAADGTHLWSADLGAPAGSSSPVVSDGRVFIGDNAQALHAFALDGGADRITAEAAAARPPDPASLHPRRP